MIGVQNMGPIGADPALLGGPSTKPLSEDDPMLQPVNGVSLEMYGKPPPRPSAGASPTRTAWPPWSRRCTASPPPT